MSDKSRKIIFLLLAIVNLIIFSLYITIIVIGILYPNKLPIEIEITKTSSVVQHSIMIVASVLSTFLFMKVHCIKELNITNEYWIERLRRNSLLTSEELFPNSAGYKKGYNEGYKEGHEQAIMEWKECPNLTKDQTTDGTTTTKRTDT
jgi:hypothetical protein